MTIREWAMVAVMSWAIFFAVTLAIEKGHADADTPIPSPLGGPSPIPPPWPSPTLTPPTGDLDCSGAVDARDALVVLQLAALNGEGIAC